MGPKAGRASCGCMQVRAFAFAQGGLVAAARLHERLLAAVVAAPAAFHDATPFGRVFNRFSSDVAIADDALPFILSTPFKPVLSARSVPAGCGCQIERHCPFQ